MWKGRCKKCGHVNKLFVNKCGDEDKRQARKLGKGCGTGMAQGVWK